MAKKGSEVQGSAQPPVTERPVKSKKKLPKLIVLLLIVGAVFNRDLLGLAYTYKMKFHTRGSKVQGSGQPQAAKSKSESR
jgi:hypothetical protein